MSSTGSLNVYLLNTTMHQASYEGLAGNKASETGSREVEIADGRETTDL